MASLHRSAACLYKDKEAIECYESVLKIDPYFKQAWVAKIMALGNLGKFESFILFHDMKKTKI